MADISVLDPQGRKQTPELFRAAKDQAENAIVLWQDIEFHLTDARDKISKISSDDRGIRSAAGGAPL
jgi:hypothetical protein